MDEPTITSEHSRAHEHDHGATRRTVLHGLGAAAVGGLAAVIAGSGTASANVGPMQYGTTNNAVNAGTGLTADTSGPIFEASHQGSAGDAIGLSGRTHGSGTGVVGFVATPTTNGWGVLGQVDGQVGIAVLALGGHAQLRLSGATPNPVTGSGGHSVGEVVFDVNNTLWVCVATGTPGTWRKLASTATAGAFHAITPSRVFDSRKPMSSKIFSGDAWTVSVANRINPATGFDVEPNIVPIGATAVAYNLTIVGTTGTNGYLAVNEGGNSTVNASAINWYGAGQTAANGSVVKVSDTRQVSVICGGTATSTHFIIDVVGYYR